jgi:hypothetical protein
MVLVAEVLKDKSLDSATQQRIQMVLVAEVLKDKSLDSATQQQQLKRRSNPSLFYLIKNTRKDDLNEIHNCR